MVKVCKIFNSQNHGGMVSVSEEHTVAVLAHYALMQPCFIVQQRK